MAGIGTMAIAGAARADDIYRWTDKAGRVHISNAPTVADRSTGVESERMPSAPAAAAEGAPATPDAARTPESDAISNDASVRRNALERDLRATERRQKEIDAQLAVLARARTRFAGGLAMTGGVGTNAGDVRSDEEKALLAERDKLTDHAAKIRAEGTKLRDEVSEKVGGTPDWWNDLR
jgi:hypothetical protein